MGRNFWAGHIEAWRASGETQAAYCRRLGLSAITFCGWKRCFERQRVDQGSSEGAAAFVAVELSESAPEAEPRSDGGI